MSYIKESANFDVWEKYFVDQATHRNNGQHHKPAYPISGGITAINDTLQLNRIGITSSTAATHSSNQNKKTEIKLTSPAQSSVQQAKSELKSLTEEDNIALQPRRKDRKRKIVSKKVKEVKKKPKKSSKKARDIFSPKF